MATEKKAVRVEDQISTFLTETQRIQQQYELERISTKCFAQNPYQVLSLPFTATPNDISKQFRTLSLIIHPDKVEPEQKDTAQKVFYILNNAKLTLTETDKRIAFDEVVQQAREVVSTKQQSNVQKKPLSDQEVDELINDEIKEILIERAWEHRQSVKAAALAAERAEAERQQQIKQREETTKEIKELDDEDKRETRAQSWRNFANKSGGRLNKRPPPSTAPQFSASNPVKRAR